jgi:hypothetical protein
MINYYILLLGKPVQVSTEKAMHEGIFEGIQALGPNEEASLFVIIKVDEDRTIFIPERLVERIHFVGESLVPGQDGEES